MHRAVTQACSEISFGVYKNGAEYFFEVNDVLFFETSKSSIDAHTKNNVFQVKKKLYELEKILPRNFVRISKSTIINIRHVYSLDKPLASSWRIQFVDTHKQVYVSRNYYKTLKLRLEEKRGT